MIKMCQMGGCTEEIEEKEGVSVSLRTPYQDEKRAGYCCAYHAALSLLKLALDRKEVTQEQIRLGTGMLTSRWKITRA
jgi:hypothetical protein